MHKLGTLPSGWLGAIASPEPTDPRPFLVDGVRVRFDPIGRKAVRAARAACAAVLRADPTNFEDASDVLSRVMIAHGIAEWEGIGDAEGVVAPVTAETIEQFLDDVDLCAAAELVYVHPWLRRDTEKNASAGSSPGTSPEGTPAKDIATRSASGGKTAAANRTRKPRTKKRA